MPWTSCSLVGRTIVIIAHRRATMAKCDPIHVLEEGRLVRSGSHSELFGELRILDRPGEHQAASAISRFSSLSQAWNIRIAHRAGVESRRPGKMILPAALDDRRVEPALLGHARGSSKSSAHGRNGPLIQSPIGIANPAFGPLEQGGGSSRYSSWRRICLPCPPRTFIAERYAGSELPPRDDRGTAPAFPG